MRLEFDLETAEPYRSGRQQARVLTEGWFAREMSCLRCERPALGREPNNSTRGDFRCGGCGAGFELKSSRMRFGARVADGAFDSMMRRLEREEGGPHRVLLEYTTTTWSVRHLSVVPAPLLTPRMIERRPPLGPTARRAGHVMCNIRISDIPASARVTIVDDGLARPWAEARAGFARFAAISGSLTARSWIVETLACLERLPAEFTLEQLYAFEPDLRSRFPGNRHIRDKLRQQLQRLRDQGLVLFLGNGRYRRSER